jgi:hypothetical protein
VGPKPEGRAEVPRPKPQNPKTPKPQNPKKLKNVRIKLRIEMAVNFADSKKGYIPNYTGHIPTQYLEEQPILTTGPHKQIPGKN